MSLLGREAGEARGQAGDVKGKKCEPHLATALWTSPGNPFTRRQSARMGADQAPWGAHILQCVPSPSLPFFPCPFIMGPSLTTL